MRCVGSAHFTQNLATLGYLPAETRRNMLRPHMQVECVETNAATIPGFPSSAALE